MPSGSTTTPVILELELSPEDALFQGKVRGLIATLHVNERPLRGLAGSLDWRFHGAISRALRLGAIEGAEGECAYLPITPAHLASARTERGAAVSDPNRVFHLVLLGRGPSDAAGARVVPPASSLARLRKNLLSLRIEPMGISRSDFGSPSDDGYFANSLNGVPLCVVP